jgi:hypothetical protein
MCAAETTPGFFAAGLERRDRLVLPPNPLPGEIFFPEECMHTTAPPLELQAIEKLREEELEEARSIQSVMLPAESLRAGKVSISHAFQPMAEVGGDFLDYLELTDGSVGPYIGDVSGKGLPAAMYAALAVGTLRGVHKTGPSPGDVLATLNRRHAVPVPHFCAGLPSCRSHRDPAGFVRLHRRLRNYQDHY